MIDIPVSYGELIDKITILEIKKEKIKDATKLRNIQSELEELSNKIMAIEGLNNIVIDRDELLEVNKQLWDVEDSLRNCEQGRHFDENFIELARSVYKLNDERSIIKKKINTILNSRMVEEKSYTDYDRHKRKITVMLSIYEAGEWIKNRLDNLMGLLNIDDCEIWCVNANSPDVRDHEIPSKYDKIRYVKLRKRQPLYTVWNYIINSSDSDYITCANADDIVSPECYLTLSNTLDNNPDLGFTYPNWYVTHDANQAWSTMANVEKTGVPGRFNGDINTSGVGHFPMWRRSLHKTLGLFDDTFGALADADWWCRCYYNGIKFGWVSEFLACYLYRNGQNLWHKSINGREWEYFYSKLHGYKAKT